MAVRLELPKDLVKLAFKSKIDSLKRAQTAATNPLIKSALDDELGQITQALGTMTEIK